MKIIFVTGSDFRHFYVVKCFSKYFKNFKWIIEKRDININHKKLITQSNSYKKHVANFQMKQGYYFKNVKDFYKKNKDKVFHLDRKKITPIEFNNALLKNINEFEPNVLVSYGCQKIDIDKIKKRSLRCLNVHGGLLPKYKGVNTNFWPHKNLESDHVGITLHEITNKIDSGRIFFQTNVKINKNDTVNTLSCKAIKYFSEIVPIKLYQILKKNFYIKGIKIQNKFKPYLKKNFKPRYIKIAYRNLKIFINSKSKKKQIKLINLF